MNKKLFKEVHNELTRLADFIMKNFQEDIKDKKYEGELVVDTAIRLLKKSKNNREHLKTYLDNAIRHWWKKRENFKNEEDKLIIKCYIDAFQGARISLLGEYLIKIKNIKSVKL